ncbi:MAG: class I SAM-dependent methyltransferase [bacterium]|nr:class I SAM-dependent methyltransferase [bacterium]
MIAIYKFNTTDRTRVYSAQNDFTQYEKQSFWPLLEKKLTKDGSYLDAGCGIGGWILFLSERGFTVQGIDAHPQAVRAMTEYDPDLSVKIARSDAIPCADNSLDGVISIGSLEYGENIVEESLQEFHRVVKKDGFVCIEVPLANTLRKLFYVPMKKLEGMIKRSAGQQGIFAYYLFDKSPFEALLKKNGFEIESIQAHDLPDASSHFGLYANWPFLRGSKPYELNALGKVIKSISNAISPWIASAGMVVIAKKR